MKYLVVIEKMGNNYGAYSPDVDGCVATGATISETIGNMKEAMILHLEGEEVQPFGIEYWFDRTDIIAKQGAIFVELGLDNEIVGTKNAFQIMISERGVYKKLNVDRSTVANWKRYLERDKLLSVDKMEQMLEKAGWQVVSKQAWRGSVKV
jgi:predicted RNase H-like HicB family nuclease